MGALLASVFAGDRGAARDLTARILLPILDTAVSRTLLGSRGQRFEKTDVIQEVFHHLYHDDWRRLRSYDAEKGSFSSYIWAITRSWLRDHERRLPPPQPIESMEAEVSPDSGPEQRAALAELIGRLKDALTDDELALFQWIYLEGASHAVVAERLAVGVEAVHKRVQRQEAKIRALVSGQTSRETETGSAP
jgi:RNA polymerase sigma factor (sigma-70 family)